MATMVKFLIAKIKTWVSMKYIVPQKIHALRRKRAIVTKLGTNVLHECDAWQIYAND